MTPYKEKEYEDERDAILADFLNQCPDPTPAQIAEWRLRYPDFAAEIIDFAADLLWLLNNRGGNGAERTVADCKRADEAAMETFRQIQRRIARNGRN